MNDMTADTAKGVKEIEESGGNPADFCWPFNGLRPDGQLFSLGPAPFVSWASAMHPEYVDEETGMPLLYDFVFTQADEEILGIDGLAGTVMVTILPSLDNVTKYWIIAEKAADRYPANPKIAERFRKLSDLFLDSGL